MPNDLLFNPRTYDPAHFDPETRRLLRATIDWFETHGKKALMGDYVDRTWYADFLEFAAKERLFATFLTPSADAAGDEGKRWDTARNAALNEIFGFYGLNYWYTWQVTILGLGPVWQSTNPEARARAAQLLSEGHVMAFGMSEKSHGADIYQTDMVLTPDGKGGFRANGSKYYIGNGNVAGLVSVFGRRCDIEGPDGYVFFAADSRHPDYHRVAVGVGHPHLMFTERDPERGVGGGVDEPDPHPVTGLRGEHIGVGSKPAVEQEVRVGDGGYHAGGAAMQRPRRRYRRSVGGQPGRRGVLRLAGTVLPPGISALVRRDEKPPDQRTVRIALVVELLESGIKQRS